ncbi:hypothetical protein NW759_008297 [Fusarium solani]|nr:hypothetical protein NW759_008297 [Fusarium solani]
MALHSQQWMRKGGLKLAPRSDFRGCILRDAVGLGKSLTALVAALELRDELPQSHPRRGPVLVVCRSGCIFQWVEEIRKHWKRAHRPSVLVFNNRAYPHDALTKYDVVISSRTFVRGLLYDRDIAEFHDYLEHAPGTRKAIGRFGELKIAKSPKRMEHPLNPSIARLRGIGFSVLIFDESQDVPIHESSRPGFAVRIRIYAHSDFAA